jgi:hypothetical protein
VHEGNIADRDDARLLLGKALEKLPRMQKLWADRGYNGKIDEWMKERLDGLWRSSSLRAGGFGCLLERNPHPTREGSLCCQEGG